MGGGEAWVPLRGAFPLPAPSRNRGSAPGPFVLKRRTGWVRGSAPGPAPQAPEGLEATPEGLEAALEVLEANAGGAGKQCRRSRKQPRRGWKQTPEEPEAAPEVLEVNAGGAEKAQENATPEGPGTPGLGTATGG
ncbi:hypothetical protein GCM10010342_57380 [Streptomyces anulatus]|nr:hypothetical protein GCM10010342_57380 [Streptomyces anulatus]